ncbi:hypothetical protein WJX77_000683 [Trebouxia sp. C0004]
MGEVLYEGELLKHFARQQAVVHKLETGEIERQVELKEAPVKLDHVRNSLLHEHEDQIQQLLCAHEMQQPSVLEAKAHKPEAFVKKWGLGVGYSSAEPKRASYIDSSMAVLIEDVKKVSSSQAALTQQWGVHVGEVAAVKHAQEELGIMVKDLQDQMGIMMKLVQHNLDEIKSHLLLHRGQGGDVGDSMNGSSIPASTPLPPSLPPPIFGLDGLSSVTHAHGLQANVDAMADTVSPAAPCGPVAAATPATLNAADAIELGHNEEHVAAAIILPAQEACDHLEQQAMHLPGVPWFASLPIPGILLGMADSDTLLEDVTSVIHQGLLATQEAGKYVPSFPWYNGATAPSKTQDFVWGSGLTRQEEATSSTGGAPVILSTPTGLSKDPEPSGVHHPTLSPALPPVVTSTSGGAESEDGYVPSMPWYDPGVAPACSAAAALGECLHVAIKPPEMLQPGPDARNNDVTLSNAEANAKVLVAASTECQEEYVPTMPWWDPTVASACFAEASGEPTGLSKDPEPSGVHHPTLSPALPPVVPSTSGGAESEVVKGKSQAASRASPSQTPLRATHISGASSACQDVNSPTQVATEDLDGWVDAQRADASRASPSPACGPAAHTVGLMSPTRNITTLAGAIITDGYVPSMPWYDPGVAPACSAAAALGECLHVAIKPPEMLQPGPDARNNDVTLSNAEANAKVLVAASTECQGEYVPTMPWWDPTVASACFAAASGEPGDHPTQYPQSMLQQGTEAQSDLAIPCEEMASAADDAEIQAAGGAHASMILAEGLGQDADGASPSLALAPTAHTAGPIHACLEPILPAQAVIKEKMFVSPGFQRRVEADYDEGQHGSWREACTMFPAGVPSKVYTTPQTPLFSLLGSGVSSHVHYGQKQVGRRGLEEAVALKWVPLLEAGNKQMTTQEVASLKAVGKRLAQMPLPHNIISHKDDYRVKADDGILYHVIITEYSEGMELWEALAYHQARLHPAGHHFVHLVQRCLSQTFQGLEALHSCGWAHMDMRMDNVRANISAHGRRVQCQVISLGCATKASAREQCVRMPAWSHSPELLRATTPGKPFEPHVDNRLHDSWAMGCLIYEAVTALPLFGNHMDAYKAQAVAALMEAGSSEQDDGQSQMAVHMRFVLLQHELWAEDYTANAAALKLSNMLKAHITDVELRMHAVTLILDLLHPNPNYRATVQEALTSDFLAI